MMLESSTGSPCLIQQSLNIKRYYRHTKKRVSEPDMTTNNVAEHGTDRFQYVCLLHKALPRCKNLRRHEIR